MQQHLHKPKIIGYSGKNGLGDLVAVRVIIRRSETGWMQLAPDRKFSGNHFSTFANGEDH